MAVAGYAAASWWFAGEVVAFPVMTAAEVLADDGVRGPSDAGLPPPDDLAIPSGDAMLSAWLFRNPDPAGCGVAFGHGHRSTRHGSLKFAPLFWRRGCHLLLFDARHHGATGGATYTWGAREKWDLLHAVDALAAATGLRRARIGIFGDSLGAAVSLQTAALAPDLAFVVADSTFSDLPAILAKRGVDGYGRWVLAFLPGALAVAAVRGGFDPWAISPARDAASIRIPVLLVHAREDAFIPAAHSEAVFARIPGTRKALTVTKWGAEHARSVMKDPVAYERMVDAFLDAYVPGFGRTPAR